MTSDPITAGLSQEMDMLPNDNHIADACTHCHVFLDCIYVKNIWSRSGVTQSGAELLWSGKKLTTKVGEQPWPQLMRYALICCRMYGCVFQEDRIVARSFREE